ncbi:MAG: hypothetical protein Q9190_004373 [Brigantiaea leucoxantha]
MSASSRRSPHPSPPQTPLRSTSFPHPGSLYNPSSSHHRPLNSSQPNVSRPAANTVPSPKGIFRPPHLRNYSISPCCTGGEGWKCEHGALSPKIRPGSPSSATLDADEAGHDFGGRYARSSSMAAGPHEIFGDAIADGVFGDGRIFGEGKDDARSRWSLGGLLRRLGLRNGDYGENGDRMKTMSTTEWLARRHGVKNKRSIFSKWYLVYYLPFLQWTSQYRLSFLKGDIIAALTMASFYLPMSLSYASNLGHVPPINGLYSFVFNPFVYALLGSCPQMVVGPEAAGSLLLGSVVKSSVDVGHSGEDDDFINARIAGVVTGMAGAVIFIAGITRLGFLDSVLSRPFLRGFISAIGFVIFVDQLIPEMGLARLAKHVGGVSHGSSLDKVIFLLRNVRSAHGLTCGVAFGSFAVIMASRTIKRRLQPRIPAVAYVPDRFIVVVLSAVLTWRFGWNKKGLDILGDVKSSTGSPFAFHWPFIPTHMSHIREAMSTSFLIALLGFFESSVAAKSLGGGGGKQEENLQGMSLSANRELVALGVANLIGGCFMALPAFGGYGRSKVNASTGGKTPMSSVILSVITKAVLSAMISVVAYSLIEEAPHDVKFFVQIRGYSELALMSLIFLATVFYSLPLGIALGIGLSLLSVIRHATKPRIQIMGKVPHTHDQFENAEDNPQALEFIEGCLIVKMPEPLTFANTGDLKNRLRRLELYGTTNAHPALPRVRSPEHNSNVIFDVHGVTGMDGSGTQVMTEIVESYVARGVRVFFCRVPKESSPVYRMFEKSGIVEKCGGTRHFVKSVDEALRMAELQSLSEYYDDHP